MTLAGNQRSIINAARDRPSPSASGNWQCIAERVAEGSAQALAVDGIDHVVTASIGITYAKQASAGHPDRITADEIMMLQNADAAMYRAKDRGKDRYELFDYGGQLDGVLRAHRSAEVEPLHAVAAERLQRLDLLLALDTFGDDLELQRLADLHDDLGHR